MIELVTVDVSCIVGRYAQTSSPVESPPEERDGPAWLSVFDEAPALELGGEATVV